MVSEIAEEESLDHNNRNFVRILLFLPKGHYRQMTRAATIDMSPCEYVGGRQQKPFGNIIIRLQLRGHVSSIIKSQKMMTSLWVYEVSWVMIILYHNVGRACMRVPFEEPICQHLLCRPCG